MTHNIIKTENYLLVVDDSKIKQNDWCIYRTGEVIHYLVKLNTDNLKKITAHLPLNNSPVLEGVPLLPPLEDEVEELSEQEFPYIKDSLVQTTKSEQNKHTDTLRWGFKKGYNKAKERYKYTEEDLTRAFNIGINSQFESTELKLNKDESFDRHSKNLLKLIQSLQQPKMPAKRPVAFECEEIYCGYMEDEALMKPKTTTNPQGQTVLVGKYIY